MTNRMYDRARAFYTGARAQTAARLSFIMLRLYLGVFYITTGTSKLGKGDFGLGYQDSLVDHVTGSLERAPAFYAWFLEHVVLAAPALFTLMISWGETALGVALLLGIFVRLAGFMGGFMALNFALSSGRALWLPSFDVTLTLALVTLALGRAGRSLGVDQYLAKKFSRYWAG